MENEQDRIEYRSSILDPDFGERIAVMVEEKVTKSLEGLDIEAEITNSLEGLDIEAIINAEIERAMHKVEHKLAKARHRIQERAHRAQERAARAAERAARRAEHRTHHVSARFDMQEGEPDGPPPVSEEEQLSILRMLQEGTITTEQADMLLNALAA
jgi:hypothetical protein